MADATHPFEIDVILNLSGRRADEPGDDRPKVAAISPATIDRAMEEIAPRVAFNVENSLTDEGELTVNLKFRCLSDFQPEAISKQVPALAKLLEARQMLDDLMQAMDGKAEAQALVDKILRDPELLLSFAGGREGEATSPGAPAPSGGPKSK